MSEHIVKFQRIGRTMSDESVPYEYVFEMFLEANLTS